MMEIDGIKMYTINEVSEKLLVTPATARRYVKEGKLDAVKVGTRLLVSEARLRKFLQAD